MLEIYAWPSWSRIDLQYYFSHGQTMDQKSTIFQSHENTFCKGTKCNETHTKLGPILGLFWLVYNNSDLG